jgi:hypothetical protein
MTAAALQNLFPNATIEMTSLVNRKTNKPEWCFAKINVNGKSLTIRRNSSSMSYVVNGSKFVQSFTQALGLLKRSQIIF